MYIIVQLLVPAFKKAIFYATVCNFDPGTMASNSRGNQSYGYGFSDDKVAVKPVAQPAKPVKTKEAPKPKPQVMAQSGKKRVSHSRYMPFLIILIVLTLGMVFIGLVMTIVAHWPGYSAIGGNPLEIAGPVLLSVGAAGFIICMVIVCTQKSAEKKSYQKRFNKLATNARMYVWSLYNYA